MLRIIRICLNIFIHRGSGLWHDCPMPPNRVFPRHMDMCLQLSKFSCRLNGV